ncbi:disulfide bond formation protein B [Candidatus Eisenbacteria bacterium]|uniref:Disulfide bond formation protein B n=1 Tax=Eiseniibacteriota bacterium TaxID=2212470 RepID=A0ABV6YIH8_UNCEI
MRSRHYPNLFPAWLVACTALVLSLYFSEGRGWQPCALCWYQRICLWPLVPILGLAILRRASRIVPCLLPQVFIGLLLAAYQVVIQEFVGSDILGICRSGPDCAVKASLGLGLVSIPMMSLVAFAIVCVLLIQARD